MENGKLDKSDKVIIIICVVTVVYMLGQIFRFYL